MIKLEVGNDYQAFRRACLKVIDEDLEICYNDSILKHNFNFTEKLKRPYKHHSKQEDGAMVDIEREIISIYQIFHYGGILTQKGDFHYLNQEHEYKVEYAEGESMIGMKKLRLTNSGRNIFTNTFYVECDTCGHKGYSSVKTGFLPKCPKCSGEAHEAPQIKANDLVEKCDLMDRVEDRTIAFYCSGENGFSVKLKLDNAQNKTLEQVRSGNDFKQAVLDLFAMDNGEIDKMTPKKEEPPVVAPVPQTIAKKPATTSRSKYKSKITDDDLVFVLTNIRGKFATKSFKSRDLAPHVVEKLTARQLPSRLTQLVNKGILSADTSSPKNYKLIIEEA